jgi:hypothetical protein
MGTHPLNLFFRFLLELSALAAYGYWGLTSIDGWPRFLLAVGLPILGAVLWGTFAVPDDPSRSGKALVPVAGWLRLILELVLLGLAAGALFGVGKPLLAAALAAGVLVHYLLSYDRVSWLLDKESPNN